MRRFFAYVGQQVLKMAFCATDAKRENNRSKTYEPGQKFLAGKEDYFKPSRSRKNLERSAKHLQVSKVGGD